jgi:hypothetical protein
MRVFRTGTWWAALIGAAAACADGGVTPPEVEPVRTVLVHRQDTGENVLLNSDGSEAGRYTPGSAPLALAASVVSQTLVLLDGNAVVVGRLDQPGLDTILFPAPVPTSLAAISDDERFVAIVSFQPVAGLILYDRADRRADTLDFGSEPPALAPVISPNNDEIVLFSVTPLSLIATTLYRTDPTRRRTHILRVSRVLDRPIFGWPRWVDDGILMAFVRVAADAPDTLVVGLVRPDAPNALLEERYRAVMAPVSDARPELGIFDASTYAFTRDGDALALGAEPQQGTGRHAIYLVTPNGGRVQLVRDDPGQFLAYPLFIRE